MTINVIQRKDVIYKNNTSPLFIRLSHNRRTKYLSLGVSVMPEHWNADKQQIDESCPQKRTHQLAIDTQIETLQKKIRRLEALEIEVTFETLLDNTAKGSRQTIAEYTERQIKQLKQTGKISTSIKYQATLTSLRRFRSMNIPFNEITPKFLTDFELFLHDQKLTSNSIATKFSVLKAIYNKAVVDKVCFCTENPFASYKVGRLWTSTRKRAIRKEDVQRLMHAPLPYTRSPYLEFARDIFLFSYLSAGINFKDISTLRYCDIDDDRIYYARHKTKKEMTCHLVPQVKEIFAKYNNPNHNELDYIFPILNRHVHATEQQIHNRIHKVLVHVNKGLRYWSHLLGLKTILTTYVARHTFATVLKRSGVNIAIISESLGHSDLSTTQIYLDSFENSQIDEAMKNLL